MSTIQLLDTEKYARCIKNSKTVRWDVDNDVIKGRDFDLSKKYLPDGLSLIRELTTLSDAEQRLVSQIQGRTYANMFGLVERFITAKLLEVGREHSLGNQIALEALVRFRDEELKHQALFRRIESMMAATMPAGYRFDIDPDLVASAVLSKSTWAVLILTLHIELFVQNHYRQSIEPDEELSELFKDVFLFHWKDECQHVILDELEVKRHDAMLTPEARDRAVDDFWSRPSTASCRPRQGPTRIISLRTADARSEAKRSLSSPGISSRPTAGNISFPAPVIRAFSRC